MTVTAEQAQEYCRDLVAKADRDRYLTSLLAPPAHHPDLWALYAFNVEIATVREQVSEPQIGEIRLQWWADAVRSVYARAPQEHPVAQSLARTIRRADLPQHAFINMIEARRFDLYDDPMLTMNDLEGYLGETSSMLMQLAARVLCGDAAYELAELSGYAGVAYGLTGLIRSLPIHCARGQCYLPLDMLARSELTPAHVLSRQRSDACDLVLSKLRHKAAARLQEARALQHKVPVAALAAYWPASIAEMHLTRMAKSNANRLKTASEVSQLRCQLKLLWLRRTETF